MERAAEAGPAGATAWFAELETVGECVACTTCGTSFEIGLRLWAILTLGDGFMTRLPPLRLSAAGPCRWLRHPSELGLPLAAAGGSILLVSPPAALAVTLLVPLTLVGCRREETALTAARTAASS
ncbi:MAG TPA: isoprenylcysteine carboxylmethyltransferase family protein [Kofleriaceae bacterium]|nr:isoprenylcysteine carboxylmethyltransferase family protein [Kofleriaceae bacterium]